MTEIVYLYLNFFVILCEDDLHYLQYIPEDEIGGTEDVLSVTLTHSNNQAGLLLLGGITDPEAMGRTVPSVKAASLLLYDGMNFFYFSPSKSTYYFQGLSAFLIYPLMNL